MTVEPTDYAASLERVALEINARDKMNDSIFARGKQISVIRQAAVLIRRQAEEVARLRALLADLEWAGGEHMELCPLCEEYARCGHKADCRLKAALDGR